MIEKRITQQLLEAGELTLTEREAADLALPQHSTTLSFELEGEPFHVQWSGRSRQLTGDLLTERLQDYGQDRGLLRLRQVGEVYRLLLLPPGTSPITPPVHPPVVVVPKLKVSKVERRRTVDRQFHADSEYDWKSSPGNSIGFLKEARKLLGEQLKAAGFDPLEIVELRLQGEELATLDDFDELLAVDVANVDRMPHQEAVARHALSRLRGRAVLADEVGLGKTIEAGLAIKELTLRGLAKRVLILCPAPLREQWREEMNHKFDLTFDVALNSREVGKQDKLILTLNLGTRAIDKLTAKPWDIVIVDEAHRAAGKNAKKTRELITALTTACRYAFFLTATPVQNDLLELYRLVELLRPGTFTSVNDFKRQFMKSSDPRTPNDPAALRRLISSAMIRTTRAQAGVDRVQRVAVDVPVDLGPRERELYALSTDLLRNVMRDSGDTMRRRSLALRLTASPFSMGTTAMRMAERHPNPRVRSVLSEVGHLAMDIQGSARENKALEITRGWVREHGRVLIFTQHTDTVTGLLRRMDAEGLHARSFHGSMSPSERAKTIAAFRSGEAPVMISTDAGAEGQNLQFCNCVLNFDLPWNPMRIEQRIGRVDRLTQPKDEVFVANLYARGTIDESVYQLLALKLRMFELLFGQVTTILGELDDSKSASFETRVMEALFADNDSKMQGLLTQLGTELAQARDRASTLIATDSGLSNWMASAFEHRKDLTKAGSSELAPAVSERARMRQRRVQKWARKVLKALDARLLHDTGEGDGAFLTAEFDEEFEEELGGRTVMHLAFDRMGLEQHPDAELCAVGSPVFDELLGLLRMRGDMHATVPVIPDDIGPSPYKHASTLTLVRRRLIPSGSWSGQATFRATIGEAETSEHLITADINGHNKQRLPRRPLQDGETLPAVFNTPSEVVDQFEKSAAGQLESLRRDREKQVTKDQAHELKRIAKGYSAQIDEATYEDKARLTKALRSEEKRLSRQPDIRARAKVLAVTLEEDDWIVEETWAGPSGDERELTYEWGLPAPVVESDVSGKPIKVLAHCSGAHWIDESESTHCGSCDKYLCTECGDDAVFADCPICGTATCRACRTKTSGLCSGCATPVRAPQLDEEYAVAWTLSHGATLLVGGRVAQLIRPSGWTETLLSKEDIADRERARIRSYAAQNKLPFDCGLAFRDLTHEPPHSDETRVRIGTATAVDIEFSLADTVGTAIDSKAVADLPKYSDTPVRTEQEFRLESVLQNLRRNVPPPAPPTILVTRRSRFTDFYLEADRMVKEVTSVDNDGSFTTNTVEYSQLQWRGHAEKTSTLATAALEPVRLSIQARNEAILVSIRKPSYLGSEQEWLAGPDETSLPHQLGSFAYLDSRGKPGGRLGKRLDEAQSIKGPFPAPTECTLVSRDIQPVVEHVGIESDFNAIAADIATLATFGVQPNQRAAHRMARLPDVLKQAFLSRAQRPFTDLLCNGFEVTETWQGHSRAIYKYRSFDGEPVFPKLDDIGIHETDFGVCRDGHFYAAGTAERCEACDSWACRACDSVGGLAAIKCTGCSASVCRRCSISVHTVSRDHCLLCNNLACSDCGRDPQVSSCPVCKRNTCGACRVGEVCPACSDLHVATRQEMEGLPVELAAVGASVLIGTDADATVVVMTRGGAAEQALIRHGSIAQWFAFGRNMIDFDYRLRLAASAKYRTQMVPIHEVLVPETALPDPHLVLETERTFHATWSSSELQVAERSATVFTRPDQNLASLAVDELPSAATLPDTIPRTPPAVAQILKGLQEPTATSLRLRWERHGHDVAITPAGILEVTVDGSGAHRQMAAWSRGHHAALPTWVAEAWQPAPRLYAYAIGQHAEAAIFGLASLRVLGVRRAAQVDWYVIRPSENAAAATALSRSMGLGDADGVSAFTDPAKLRLSTVTNAASSPTLNVDPVGALTAGPRMGADTTWAALAAWTPTASVVTPDAQPLSARLAAALEQTLGAVGPQTTLTIGAQLKQLVTVYGGQEWHYDRQLAAGQRDARRVSKATGHAMDVGMIDREGHFGVDSPPCEYCGGRTCAECVDRMLLCTCCTMPICKRCARGTTGELSLCPACITTRSPTRKEAREHGRLFMTRRMLIGTDPQHTVVFELSKDQWTRHVPDKDGQIVTHAASAAFLNERLAGSGSTPPNE
ncbi:DEAD/DEAH box helicase [Mycolicibacterium alvei]|uniref:Helicase n=1 Tax=Mycolicibacterium alvei TaxID=67081 RepID=A0A6N4UU36_9MYCO|nr:SNF2-related protein [Mycolicibacterium alvei]MCV7002213.1 DEAD/DEAH box helicase [Mycolicibacterium alvei]BBX27445.1 hypothetical protein MALV_25700 [Mycolicibacterium alvei]